MTNEELGRRIGVTHSMASRIRAGKRLPSVQVMLQIHERFGVPCEELLRAHVRGPEAFGRVIRRAVEQKAARA